MLSLFWVSTHIQQVRSVQKHFLRSINSYSDLFQSDSQLLLSIESRYKFQASGSPIWKPLSVRISGVIPKKVLQPTECRILIMGCRNLKDKV